jgi:hypothetical protein
VKKEAIIIEKRAREELYQGIKYAIKTAKNNIIKPSKTLSVIIFQTILLESSLFAVISLIAIAYNHKSAKKTKIQI